jgi:YidC/Oxa1 family membrane protein insertase
VVAGGPFFPLAILLYWLSNNLWTLAQQRVVYQRIDAEEEEKKETAVAQRQALAPKPGQKPSRPKKDGTESTANLVGGGTPPGSDDDTGSASNGAGPQGHGSGDVSPDSAGTSNGQGSASADGSVPPGMIQQRPRPRKKSNRKRR